MAQELGVDVTNVVEKGRWSRRSRRAAAAGRGSEDESDGPGEHMSVLFELLPFIGRATPRRTPSSIGRCRRRSRTTSAVDDEGATPLVVCAQYGHEDLVEALLERVRTSTPRRTRAARPSCTRAAVAGVLLRAARREAPRPRRRPEHPGAPPRSRAAHYLAATGHERLCRELVMRGRRGRQGLRRLGARGLAADAGHGACAVEVLRQLARPPQTPKTPHQVDHLEREVEKRQAVEKRPRPRRPGKTPRRTWTTPCGASTCSRPRPRPCAASATTRRTTSRTRGDGRVGGPGQRRAHRAARTELAAARAHNEEAARAHARTRRRRTTRPARPSRSSRRPSRASASIWWTRGRRPRRSLCCSR